MISPLCSVPNQTAHEPSSSASGRKELEGEYRYEGQLKEGKKHGQGICHFNNGARYEGLWENDKMHGQGTYYFQDGDRYEGSFENNTMHGQGTYYLKDGAGDRYEGSWKNDTMHGQGTLYFKDGSRHEGLWENDNMHGQGTFYESDGSRCVGNWRNNEKHGPMTYHYGGKERSVEFRDGLLIPGDLSSKHVFVYTNTLSRRNEVALVIEAKYDHNGFFQSPEKRNFLIDGLKSSGRSVIFIKIESCEEFPKLVVSCARISILWIRAHGSRKSIAFGEGEKDKIQSANLHILKPLLSQLGYKSLVVLESCSTGEVQSSSSIEPCIAEQIASCVRKDITVLAPREDLIDVGIARGSSRQIKIEMLGEDPVENVTRVFKGTLPSHLVGRSKL